MKLVRSKKDDQSKYSIGKSSAQGIEKPILKYPVSAFNVLPYKSNGCYVCCHGARTDGCQQSQYKCRYNGQGCIYIQIVENLLHVLKELVNVFFYYFVKFAGICPRIHEAFVGQVDLGFTLND